uniref:Uncharacterized protein n=1 Tax=Lotharella oceanica TaxID=641309 RepID=A0A7S2XAN9_9EUKA|mmetsp:Transcript_25304/g.47219  ORF Transcript_25304/g.47219 Transcript_25304/m.47219 type:complete len:136 (+) Transcript_25304:158-565(+)
MMDEKRKRKNMETVEEKKEKLLNRTSEQIDRKLFQMNIAKRAGKKDKVASTLRELITCQREKKCSPSQQREMLLAANELSMWELSHEIWGLMDKQQAMTWWRLPTDPPEPRPRSKLLPRKFASSDITDLTQLLTA